MAVKDAYDVIGNTDRRTDYDRQARRSALDEIEPGEIPPLRPAPMAPAPSRNPRFSDMPIAVWAVLGTILAISSYEVFVHLMALPPIPQRPSIAANAPVVPPLTPEARRLVEFGPTPVRLAGTPNFYVTPTAGVTVLWQVDQAKKAFVPSGRLPPFSSVQALRLFRQNGLVEVKLNDTSTAFIEAGRLAPGDANAAHKAYCAYNAGPPPGNGEVFHRTGAGTGRLTLDNRTSQPVAVKLRDPSGAVVMTTFLAPNGHAEIAGLPDGQYRPDFAIGELWSRACQSFAAGMRAQRLSGYFSLNALTPLAIPPDRPGEPPPFDISDDTFERD